MMPGGNHFVPENIRQRRREKTMGQLLGLSDEIVWLCVVGGGGGGWPRSTPHPPVAKRRGGNARHLATSLPVNRLEDQSEDGGSLVAVRLGERAGGRRLAARGKRYLTCSCPRGGWKRVACGVEEGKRRRRSFFAPLPVPVILFIAHLTERAFDHLEAVPLCPSLYTSFLHLCIMKLPYRHIACHGCHGLQRARQATNET
ncbi:hypothetical protein IWX49DRAFT_127852 [Phyllosticta citricarpa]